MNYRKKEKNKVKGGFVSLSLIAVIAILIALAIGTGVYFAVKSKTKRQKDSLISETTSTVFDSSELQLYEDIGKEFSILAPKGWEIRYKEAFGTLVSFINPQVDKEGAVSFRARILVSFKYVTGDTDLEELVKKQKEAFLISSENPKIIDEKNTTVSGMPAKIVESTFTKKGGEWRTIVLYVLKNEKAYIVTASASNSTWSKYKDLFESSLQSFQLK